MDYIQYIRSMVGRKPVIFVAAVVLIMDGNRLLLQRRADDSTWGLVGGIMNLGETVEEAARREVFEETGLEVGELKLFEVFSSEHTYPGGNQAQIISVIYTSDDVRGEPTVNDMEGLELRYFDLRALPEDIFAPNVPILEVVKERFPKR